VESINRCYVHDIFVLALQLLPYTASKSQGYCFTKLEKRKGGLKERSLQMKTIVIAYFLLFHQRVELLKNGLSEGGILLLLEMLLKESINLEVLNLNFNRIGQRGVILVERLVAERRILSLNLR